MTDFRVFVCRDFVKGSCSRRQCKYYHLPPVALPTPVSSSTTPTYSSTTPATYSTTPTYSTVTTSASGSAVRYSPAAQNWTLVPYSHLESQKHINRCYAAPLSRVSAGSSIPGSRESAIQQSANNNNLPTATILDFFNNNNASVPSGGEFSRLAARNDNMVGSGKVVSSLLEKHKMPLSYHVSSSNNVIVDDDAFDDRLRSRRQY